MMEGASKGPDRIYRLGRYSFGRYGWTRWEFSDGSLGGGGRTPWTAFIRQRRWHREYHANPRKYIEAVSDGGEAKDDENLRTWRAETDGGEDRP